ncbi:MAG: hypothetical protein ACKVS9_10140 [Phycisphaerae bacterium]
MSLIRATTITDLLDQGAALKDVQFLAGRSDLRTTRLYDRRILDIAQMDIRRGSNRTCYRESNRADGGYV